MSSPAGHENVQVAYAISFSDFPDRPYRVQVFICGRDGKLKPRTDAVDYVSLGHARMSVPAGLVKQRVEEISDEFVLETWA